MSENQIVFIYDLVDSQPSSTTTSTSSFNTYMMEEHGVTRARPDLTLAPLHHLRRRAVLATVGPEKKTRTGIQWNRK